MQLIICAMGTFSFQSAELRCEWIARKATRNNTMMKMVSIHC